MLMPGLETPQIPIQSNICGMQQKCRWKCRSTSQGKNIHSPSPGVKATYNVHIKRLIRTHLQNFGQNFGWASGDCEKRDAVLTVPSHLSMMSLLCFVWGQTEEAESFIRGCWQPTGAPHAAGDRLQSPTAQSVSCAGKTGGSFLLVCPVSPSVAYCTFITAWTVQLLQLLPISTSISACKLWYFKAS